jgi:hypothetical protein
MKFSNAIKFNRESGGRPFNVFAKRAKPLCVCRRLFVAHEVNAFEKNRYRPTYATANVGHPSSLSGRRKAGDHLGDSGGSLRMGEGARTRCHLL